MIAIKDVTIIIILITKVEKTKFFGCRFASGLLTLSIVWFWLISISYKAIDKNSPIVEKIVVIKS